MKTNESGKALGLFSLILDKADFDPGLHPRDEAGKFSTGAGGQAAVIKPRREAVRAVKLRAEAKGEQERANALRRAGEHTLAQAAERGAIEARKKADKLDKKPPAIVIPKPAPPPPPAPKPVAPQVKIPPKKPEGFTTVDIRTGFDTQGQERPEHVWGPRKPAPAPAAPPPAPVQAAPPAAPAAPVKPDKTERESAVDRQEAEEAARQKAERLAQVDRQVHVGARQEMVGKYKEEQKKLAKEGFKFQARSMGGAGEDGGEEQWKHPDGRSVKLRMETTPNQEWRLSVESRGGRHVVAPETPPGSAPWDRPKTVKNPMLSVKDNRFQMEQASTTKGWQEVVEKKKETGGGSGETYTITFKDGSKAIYKPEAGTVLEKFDHFKGTMGNGHLPESTRELAAYRISEMAGFHVVPVVHEGDFPKEERGRGHMMSFVEGGVEARKTAIDSNHPDLQRIAAMDFITANQDRHEGNFMKGGDGRLYAIDNGLSLPEGKRTHLKSVPMRMIVGKDVHPEVKKEIDNLKEEDLAAALRAGKFSEDTVTASISRLRVLKETKKWGGYEKMFTAANEKYDEMKKVKKMLADALAFVFKSVASMRSK